MNTIAIASLRLGKTSVDAIKNLYKCKAGVLEPFSISVVCTQVPQELCDGVYVIIWLGSDNSKGTPTEWKQGYKAFGRVKSIIRGKTYNDESSTTVDILYAFKEPINRLDFLKNASEAYYDCSALPIIGLDDHSNQTIRMLQNNGERYDIGAMFYALNSMDQSFMESLLEIDNNFNQYFQYIPPSKRANCIQQEQNTIFDYSQTILYGPPGTGKTYEMQKIFAGYPEGNRSVITFHQSYSYEEFIIGLKAKTTEDNKIEYSYEKGVFYNACEMAAVLAGYSSLAECCSDTKESRNVKFAAIAGDTSRQFLFCIDEINRANISAVFGDLISLIEENKRLGAQNEMIVRLPYTQELFGVPANLRLLGTMNTADRSIQILDTALRRRFQFKEYLPDYDVLRNEKAKTVLQAINDRIRALLGQDRQIGHSYFYDIEASAADESIRILKALANKIIPLLQEYFYNDVEKIRFVLGEKDRIPDEHSFYIEDGDATAAFSRYDSDSEVTSFYILNTEGIASASMSNESASAFIDHITA